MSWVDDNLPYLDIPSNRHVSKLWKEGLHQTQSGKKMKLSEMTTRHLKNTINYFKDAVDVKPLKNELKRRNYARKLTLLTKRTNN